MTTRPPSIRERHGHAILDRYHQSLAVALPGPVELQAREASAPRKHVVWPPSGFKVGIIGAGASGLYTAMILQDLGIEYEILEASEKVGGRLFTHRFGEKRNDYYDVGAMRYPDIPLMASTFELFRRLGYGKETKIPYYLSTPEDVRLFNGVLLSGPIPQGEDPFRVSESKGGNVPDHFALRGYQHWLDEKLGRFKNALVQDFDEGWRYLMQYDSYSFRTYMTLVQPKYPNSVVDWCETLDSGTNLFDGALTEAVMDSLDFDFPREDVKWYCIQGGAGKIARDMAATLSPNGQPNLRKRVTRIAPSPLTVMPPTLSVSVHGEDKPRSFNHVVSTLPFGALRMVNTERCGLSYTLKTAMRMLQYGGSVKVGIQFTDRWWEPTHKGGVSKTDRQTRVVVYPSYGIDDPDSGASILVSYTWGQDALRQGALVQGHNSISEEILLKLILEDLSAMHNIPYDTLAGKVKAFHEWNWYGDQFQAGAFAFFGPGQFSTLYPEVTQPAANGLLHFAGEATSVNHAWIAGALDSAHRCVMQILLHELFSDTTSLANEAHKRRSGQDWDLDLEESHRIRKLITKLDENWGGLSQELRVDLMLKQLLASRVLSD